MGVTLHQGPVHEGPGVSFVAIGHYINRSGVLSTMVLRSNAISAR